MKRILFFLILIILAVSAYSQDSTRYTRMNVYGIANKRGIYDSVLIIPVKNPAKPASQVAYRKGSIRFNQELNYVEVYNGTVWLSIQGGGSGGTAYVFNTEEFPGTTTNFYSVTNVPIISTVNIFVNGVKVPKTAVTVTNKAIQINSSLLTFSTDTNDKVEILYNSTN